MEWPTANGQQPRPQPLDLNRVPTLEGDSPIDAGAPDVPFLNYSVVHGNESPSHLFARWAKEDLAKSPVAANLSIDSDTPVDAAIDVPKEGGSGGGGFTPRAFNPQAAHLSEAAPSPQRRVTLNVDPYRESPSTTPSNRNHRQSIVATLGMEGNIGLGLGFDQNTAQPAEGVSPSGRRRRSTMKKSEAEAAEMEFLRHQVRRLTSICDEADADKDALKEKYGRRLDEATDKLREVNEAMLVMAAENKVLKDHALKVERHATTRLGLFVADLVTEVEQCLPDCETPEEFLQALRRISKSRYEDVVDFEENGRDSMNHTFVPLPTGGLKGRGSSVDAAEIARRAVERVHGQSTFEESGTFELPAASTAATRLPTRDELVMKYEEMAKRLKKSNVIGEQLQKGLKQARDLDQVRRKHIKQLEVELVELRAGQRKMITPEKMKALLQQARATALNVKKGVQEVHDRLQLFATCIAQDIERGVNNAVYASVAKFAFWTLTKLPSTCRPNSVAMDDMNAAQRGDRGGKKGGNASSVITMADLGISEWDKIGIPRGGYYELCLELGVALKETMWNLMKSRQNDFKVGTRKSAPKEKPDKHSESSTVVRSRVYVSMINSKACQTDFVQVADKGTMTSVAGANRRMSVKSPYPEMLSSSFGASGIYAPDEASGATPRGAVTPDSHSRLSSASFSRAATATPSAGVPTVSEADVVHKVLGAKVSGEGLQPPPPTKHVPHSLLWLAEPKEVAMTAAPSHAPSRGYPKHPYAQLEPAQLERVTPVRLTHAPVQSMFPALKTTLQVTRSRVSRGAKQRS